MTHRYKIAGLPLRLIMKEFVSKKSKKSDLYDNSWVTKTRSIDTFGRLYLELPLGMY